jgi:hypothetical protein
MKTERKYKFVGLLDKSKYYVSADGHFARSTRKKFIELGYIDDNWDKWKKLCECV